MLFRTFFSLLLTGFFAVAILISSATAQELPIVFEEYPPYEYIEDGEVKGINIDLIREAFRRMGLVPFFEPRPWKRALFELSEGTILALSSGFKTTERERFAYFPSEGLSMEEVVVMTRADNNITMSSLKDLRGLRIGLRTDYSYGLEFDSISDLDKRRAISNKQLLKMLFAGRVEVIIANRAVISYIAKEINRYNDLKVVYEINREPLYLFFSRARGERARLLAKKFGETIGEMKRDGTFQKIESRY